MIPEIGQMALAIALMLATALAAVPLIGARRQSEALMALGRPLALAQFGFIALAFLMLTIAFVRQDFSVAYVAQNSNSLLPLPYRFSAVWGAHEGSLLLWVLVLATWTLAFAGGSRRLPPRAAARALGVLGLVSLGFLLFTILTSNPFARHLPALVEGRDLNPLLQDPGLIIHPPLLYFGYVGFAVPFALAIATLLDGRLDRDLIRMARPWTNAAWGFLTIGIALGSWWAYYELGWGGWWFWDPVENASFMPWLVGTALIHSQAVTEKRGGFVGWTLLLAIAAFSLSLLGTFLVRSGVLTSVHAFASDPARGVFILIFLALVVGGSLLLYALKSPRRAHGEPFAVLSRETLLLSNNLLFSVAGATVLIGTLYPLAIEALGLGRISVGPPYFGSTFLALMVPTLLLMPFGPLARWRRETPDRFRGLLKVGLPSAIAAAALGVVIFDATNLRALAGFAAAGWVVSGAAVYVRHRVRMAPAGRRFTAESVGLVLAHVGVGVFALGAMLVEATGVERDVAVSRGDSVELGAWRFEFQGTEARQGPNFRADLGTVAVFHDNRQVTVLQPEKRGYASGGQIMTEAAIRAGLFRDLYVSLGEPLDAEGSSWALRIYIKPFIRFIWLGAFLMALGAFVVASDRRLRGRPARGDPATESEDAAMVSPALGMGSP